MLYKKKKEYFETNKIKMIKKIWSYVHIKLGEIRGTENIANYIYV